jgi:CBS domain containing-hemolysin-like protein
MLELVIAVGAVICISALCSLFEAVLLSTPVSHIEKLANEGKASGRIFRRLRQDVDRPLTAILSLNTIANTGGAAVAGAAFVKVFGASKEVGFTVFITLAVLFLSEVIPKTLGTVYNRFFTPIIARPLKVLIVVFAPLIAVCRLVTRIIPRGPSAHTVSGDEIITLARLGHRTGTLEADEARMIQNMLSLKSGTAKEVMTPRPVVYTLNENQTVKEALKPDSIWNHSRVPVYAEDAEDIVGILLRGEALEAMVKGDEQAPLSRLIRPVHFVLESSKLNRILKMFLEKRQHLFVVIDEYGGFSGILTLEDVLEKILGKEIVDERDEVENMRALAHERRRKVLRGDGEA